MALWNWPLEYAGIPGVMQLGCIALILCIAPLFSVLVLFRRPSPWIGWALPPGLLLALSAGLISRVASQGRENTYGHLPSPDLLSAAAQWDASAHLLLAILGLGLLLYGLLLAAGSALSVQATPGAKRAWLAPAVLITLAFVGSVTMVIMAVVLGVSVFDALALSVVHGCVGVLTAMALIPQARTVKQQRRLSATALGVWSSGCLAYVGCSLMSVHGGLAAALGSDPYSTVAIATAWTHAPLGVALSTIGVISLISMGAFVTLNRRRWLTGGSQTASGLAGITVLAAGAMGVWLAPRAAMADLHHVVQNGAVSQISPGLFGQLPRSQDTAEEPQASGGITGSCLVKEAAQGWTTQTVFAGTDPQVQLDSRLPQSAPEGIRTARCTRQPTALEGTFSPAEVPIIAVVGDRAATTLSSELWFAERGSLQLLVRDGHIPGEFESEALRRLQAAAVDFRWEMPPQVDPPPDFEPGVWNTPHAAQLPVTLIEGPYTILIANGQRSRLPSGALGRETLQLVLSSRSPEARNLVLVPRKNWTISDLVEMCLSAQAVPSTVCLLRPETSVRWALRTHLPLPW